MLFPASTAGSLPKPSWLAEPNKLWPQWRLSGDDLAQGKLDATLLAIKWQEDAGLDIVCDGEMSRQHFVHGFLEFVDGIDFANKVEMGIRADRYKAMVPQVRGELTLKGRVHQAETRHARAHTKKQLKITLPGPMTISDTIADRHYGDKVKMAFAFAGLLNQEARALEQDGVDVIQFDEPAFNVFMDEVTGWGIEALRARDRRAQMHHRRAHLLRLRHQGQYRLEEHARRRVAAIREDFSGAGQEQDRPGLARMHQFARADRADGAAQRQGRAGRRHRRRDRHGRDARAGGRRDRRAMKVVPKERIVACTNCGMAPMRREVAEAKLMALGAGAKLAREKYG